MVLQFPYLWYVFIGVMLLRLFVIALGMVRCVNPDQSQQASYYQPDIDSGIPNQFYQGAPQLPPTLRTRVQQIEGDREGNYKMSQKDEEVTYGCGMSAK